MPPLPPAPRDRRVMPTLPGTCRSKPPCSTSWHRQAWARWFRDPAVWSKRIDINFADPNTEVDGERGHVSVPHPFFSDLRAAPGLSRWQSIAKPLPSSSMVMRA